MKSWFNKNNEIVFVVGTGRCGTKFLYKLMMNERCVASYHERHPLNDTFHRFCKWYKIDCDSSGFLETKQRGIREDLKVNNVSFEASAYLSLSIEELYNCFNAKFILLIRSPEKVINSYIRKGWYEHDYIYNAEKGKIPTYQPDNTMFHHFLGRTVPYGNDFSEWANMTRIGKLAWYWKILNSRVIDQFSEIPAENTRVQQIEKLDYKSFLNLSGFFNHKPSISEKKFKKIADLKPNSNTNLGENKVWSDKETNDFHTMLPPAVLTKFGY